jgi:hypothetical protein
VALCTWKTNDCRIGNQRAGNLAIRAKDQTPNQIVLPSSILLAAKSKNTYWLRKGKKMTQKLFSSGVFIREIPIE